MLPFCASAGRSRVQKEKVAGLSDHPRKFLLWLCLAAIAIPFLPALWGDFTNWDDELNVTKNPYVLGGLRDGFLPLLTGPYVRLYIPVTYSAFWVGHHLWGDAAVGYHALNLACHLISAALLYQITKEEIYREWAIKVADYFVRTQFPDGHWINNEPLPDEPEIEIGSEFLVYLHVIISSIQE